MSLAARRLLAAAALLVALLWSVLLAQTHLAARETVLDRLEASLLDLRILAFGRREAPRDVLIVAVDDAAVRWAKAFPLPRRILGQLVTALLGGGARAVVLDTLFLDPGLPDDDQALAQALGGGPTGVAAMLNFPASGAQAPPTAQCELPIPALRRVTTTGAVNIALDRSGVVRHVPLLLPCGGGVVPALPLRAASLAAKADPAFEAEAVEVEGARTPLDVGRHLALRFYGPEASIATVSAADILAGQAPGHLAQGKTVVVGATATGVGDRYSTPFDSVLPGVEIMATAIANLETGDALIRTTGIRRIDAAATLVLSVAGAACLLVGNVGIGLLGLAVLVAAWFAMVLLGFAQGFWFAMAVPLAALVPILALTGAGRLAVDRWTERQLRRQQRTLAAFQSPAMLARLLADPDFLSRPVERDIAVLFIDLSGFTGLSERLGPQVTRDLLEAWHGLVEETSAEGGGFVASYMADGAMVVWGMTERGPDDAAQAVRGAVKLQARTLAWLRSVEPRTGPLSVKTGGHLGPAILSRLGHATHQHITAIGDTVNVASRLMEVAAAGHSTMALSQHLVVQAAAEGLGAAEASFAPPVEAMIRGREHPLPICLWVTAHDEATVPA